MKKRTMLLLALVLSVAPLGVSACPKGEHPHGGTGSHHKGGWCS